jgi:hypothetical protein
MFCREVGRGADDKVWNLGFRVQGLGFREVGREGQLKRLTDPARHETVEGTLDPMFSL